MRDTRRYLPLRKVSYKTNRGNWDGIGYFHQWVSLGYKDLDHLYAVVEKEDGSIVMVEPHKIRFVEGIIATTTFVETDFNDERIEE